MEILTKFSILWWKIVEGRNKSIASPREPLIKASSFPLQNGKKLI